MDASEPWEKEEDTGSEGKVTTRSGAEARVVAHPQRTYLGPTQRKEIFEPFDFVN